jgi:hypothetical protein
MVAAEMMFDVMGFMQQLQVSVSESHGMIVKEDGRG